MKPSLVFMMRLSGSVKFFCAFGSGASEGGAEGLLGFLRPSASRFFSTSARACRSASAAALASASSSALAARIFSARRFLSATQAGISSPLLSRPKAASSFASAAAAASIQPATSASNSSAHRRIERRLPAIDAVHPLDRLQIDLLDHQVQNEPRQVILFDELLNRRRQQHRFINLPGAIALAHAQTKSDSPRKR